ncbi:MAG: hypothetical protein ACRDO0_08760, partial [Nocardioidaceae bacterium]
GSLSVRTVDEPAGTDGGSTDSTASSGGTVSPCQWYATTSQMDPPEGSPKGGRWYVRYCDNPFFESYEDYKSTVNTWDWMNGGRAYVLQQVGAQLEYSIAPPDQPTPEERVEQIVETLEIPQGELKVNPRPGMQLLNVPTWAWIEGGEAGAAETFEEESRTLQIDGYELTFTVTPQMTIDTGDGTTLDCEAPGVPWSQTAVEENACTHTYARSGVYEMTATVAWVVTWGVNGDPEEPIEGPTTTDTLEVDVHESQAVVTDVR